MRVLYVRVPDEIGDRVDALAAGSGLTLTAVVVEILRRGLQLPSPVETLDKLIARGVAE